MGEKYPPAAMWGLYNRSGDLVRTSYDRRSLMDQGAEFWNKPWRSLRRSGTMSIRRVIVQPFVQEYTDA